METKFFETEKMEISLKKIQYYKYEEDCALNSLITLLDNIKNCYYTDNKGIIEDMNNHLIDKANIIKDIHNDNITVLNDRIKQHIETKQKNIELFKS